MSNAKSTKLTDTLLVFPSRLGWMAAVVAAGAVKQLTFGHPSAAAAQKALGRERPEACEAWQTRRPAGSASSGVRGGRTRPVGRHSRRFWPGQRVSAAGLGAVPADPLRLHDELRRVGGEGRLAAGGPGGRKLHGGQQNPPAGSMPSGGAFQRAARLLFRSGRRRDETPAAGDGIAVSGRRMSVAIPDIWRNSLCFWSKHARR